MKRFLLFFAVFFSVFSSRVMAGNPFISYGTARKQVALHEFSSSAVVFHFEAGQDMARHWLRPGQSDTTLKRVTSLTAQPNEMPGMALGKDFAFGEMAAKYIGFTGSGYVYFDVQPNIKVVANPMFYAGYSAGNPVLHYIYLNPSYLAPYYTGSPLDYRTARVYSSDSTTVKYEAEDGVVFLEYANLYIKDFTDTNVFVFSFQYRIEAEGTVCLIPVKMRPLSAPEEKTESYQIYRTNSYGLTLGLVGSHEDEDAIYMGDFEGNIAVSQGAQDPLHTKTIAWDADRYPTDALCFGLFNPCGAIAEPEVTRWQYYYKSSNFYVEASSSMAWKEGEKILLLLSEQSVLTGSNLPQDGTTYACGQQIGSSAGLIVGSRGDETGMYTAEFADDANEITGLKPGTQYYLHAFPYNVACVGGPVYNTQNIPVSAFKTYPAPPSSVRAELNSSTATLTVSHTQPYLLVMSRKQLPSDARVVLSGTYDKGAFIPYVRTMSIGGAGSDLWDTMHYSLQVLENNATANTVTVSGLEDGTDYYFYAWTNVNDGEAYSIEFAGGELAMPRVVREDAPAVVNFATGVESAAGWTYDPANTHRFDFYETLVRDRGRWASERNYIAVEATSGVSRAVSPVFDKGEFSEVAMIVDMFYWARDAQLGEISAAQPANSDSIIIEYKATEESAWHALSVVGKQNDFDPVSGAYRLETPAFAPVSNMFQIQITVKSNYTPGAQSSTPFASFRSFTVEPSLPCKPVGNLQADPASILHNQAVITWNENNITGSSSFLLRYRASAGGEWSEPVSVKAGGETISEEIYGLETLTPYVVEVTAVCGSQGNSLGRTAEFSTIGTLPYQLSARNFGDVTQKTGSIPASGPVVLQEAAEGYEGWDLADNGIALMEMKSENTVNPLWMLLPPLSSAGNRGTLSVNLHLRALSQTASGMEGEPEFASSDKCFMLISQDGSFSSADITDTVKLSEITRTGKTFTFHPSVSAAQLNIALYTAFTLPSGSNASAKFNTLTLDSLQIDWDEVVCDPVRSISQSNLGKTSVDLKWKGESLEYAVAYQIRDAQDWDTVYTDTTFCRLSGLVSGQSYQYRIWGYCSPDRTSVSEPSAIKYFNTVPPCLAPVMALEQTTDSSVTVTLEPGGQHRLVEMWVKGHQGEEAYTHEPVYTQEDVCTLLCTAFEGAMDFVLRSRTVCGAGDTSEYSNLVEARLADKPDKPDDSQGNETSSLSSVFKLYQHHGEMVLENPQGVYVKTCEIYTPDGKLIRRFAVNSSASATFRHGLPGGFVLLRLLCEGGKTFTCKLMVY